MRFKRVFVIVLDSLGIGPMADSARFDDAGADIFNFTIDAFLTC